MKLSLISFDQGVVTYKILYTLCPDNLRHKFVEGSMVSEYEMQVSKIEIMFLATSKNKSHSLVSKRDLESTFRTCKTQTRPLGRAAILLYLPFFFLIIVTTYSISFFNFAERMYELKYKLK